MIILGSDQENKLLAKGGNYMELSIQIKIPNRASSITGGIGRKGICNKTDNF